MKATVTWKEYVDTELRSVRDAVNKVEATNRQAIEKVDANNIAKFESQNEFRTQLKDQAATFVTRRELWGAVLAIMAILISAAAIVIKT